MQEQEEDKVLKVSDWSQKYKLAIYAVSGIGICIIGLKILNVLGQIAYNTSYLVK